MTAPAALDANAFARRHPVLFHLGWQGSEAAIRRHGLLSPEALCALHGVPPERRAALLHRQRLKRERVGPGAWLNDNLPLSDGPLRRCLDGVSVPDWRRALNRRVFLFPDEASACHFAAARGGRDYPRLLWRFDARSLLEAHRSRAEITPFNTGAAVRAAPLRSLETFAPLDGLDWEAWRTRRQRQGLIKGLDRVREVCVRGGVPDAAAHLLSVSPLPFPRPLLARPPASANAPPPRRAPRPSARGARPAAPARGT